MARSITRRGLASVLERKTRPETDEHESGRAVENAFDLRSAKHVSSTRGEDCVGWR